VPVLPLAAAGDAAHLGREGFVLGGFLGFFLGQLFGRGFFLVLLSLFLGFLRLSLPRPSFSAFFLASSLASFSSSFFFRPLGRFPAFCSSFASSGVERDFRLFRRHGGASVPVLAGLTASGSGSGSGAG
jgi:hypothetical protein